MTDLVVQKKVSLSSCPWARQQSRDVQAHAQGHDEMDRIRTPDRPPLGLVTITDYAITALATDLKILNFVYRYQLRLHADHIGGTV
jgi:hypothetical protein